MSDNEIILRADLSPAVATPIKSDTQRLKELWLGNQSSAHTRRAYEADLDEFLSFVALPLEQIRFDDVQAWAKELEKLGLADRTRNRKLSSIKSFFKFAVRLGRLQFDVAHPQKLTTPRQSLQQRILGESQVAALIDAAGADRKFGERDRLILEILYSCGLRIEELAELRWRDVIERDGLRMLCIFGKGRKSREITVVDEVLWQAIVDRRGGADEESRVFALSKSQMARRLKLAAKRAGLSGRISPHWLRHCFGSHAIRRGAKIDVVCRDMGHSSIKTTHQYVHPPAEESAAAFLPRTRRGK